LVFFVGDLTWPPNVEGIRWFVSEVWPILSRLRPQARVEILGRGEGSLRTLARRGPPGLSFLGEGADTRPLWRRAAVAIVPLLTGGGTRLKILEAAACGVPVVATPVGAEGLDFADGPEIAIASAAPEFAAAIARLLADPGARRLQATAARRRVESHYGWEAIGRRFGELLRVRTAGA
jgi:glycosyltransferase involved in cell wall biosynthesis